RCLLFRDAGLACGVEVRRSRPDRVRIFFQPCHLRRARCWTWPIRFQRWTTDSETRPSPAGAKEGHALDFVIPQHPVVWNLAWFSFVLDGPRFASRSFYPPISFVPDGTRYAFAP